jgi:hypothetical protein
MFHINKSVFLRHFARRRFFLVFKNIVNSMIDTFLKLEDPLSPLLVALAQNVLIDVLLES